MQVIEAIAPSAWASYLINGDASGIELEDMAAANEWLLRQNLGMPVSCDDYGFTWHHDAMLECPLGADCQLYAFLIPD